MSIYENEFLHVEESEDELYHYGIKGQKWGVRRYQNKDGSYTSLGLRVKRNRRTTDDVNKIVESFATRDKHYLGSPKNGQWIDKQFESETSENIAKRIIAKHQNKPAAFMEIWDDGEKYGRIAVGSTRQNRGQGYASDAVRKGVEWFDNKSDLEALYWEARKENRASIALAKKSGFQLARQSDIPESLRGQKDYVILKYSRSKRR